MPYGICSATWMVQFTSRVLHVVPLIFYLLAYFGLLLSPLVEISVCSCSQIIQIYVCKMIGRDELLIARVNLDLFLLGVLICPKIGCGSFHLDCILPL